MADTMTVEPQRSLTHRWGSGWHAGAIVAGFLLLSLACNWYYLGGGFQADEFFFLNMMRQQPCPYSPWLGFWAVDEVPALTNFWWFTGEGVGAFWRPLPTLVIDLSVCVFGETALPLHLLSVLTHGLVGGTLFLLVRRLTDRWALGLLAGLFFVCCEDHSMTVGWITTLTDLFCALFINLALLAHARWLRTRRLPSLLISWAMVALAMLSKEGGVVGPLLLVLMALLMPNGRAVELSIAMLRARLASVGRDWPSWAPALALVVVYLIAYRALGFGTLASGLYINPFASPGRFLIHLAEHLPIMWLAVLSPVPPSLVWFWPEWSTAAAAVGYLAFGVCLVGLWPLRRNALVIWALAAFLLALLPQMSTDAGERGLYVPMLGGAILLAALLAQIGPLSRRVAWPPATDRGPSESVPVMRRIPALTRCLAWLAGLGVLVPGLLLSAAMPYMYRPSLDLPRRDVVTIMPEVQARGAEVVLILNTPGCFHTLYPPAIVEYYAGRPVDTRVLSSMNGVVSVEPVDDRSFILWADRRGWLTNVFAGILRRPGRLGDGQVFRKGLLTATLLELTPDRRDVLAVRFELDRPLDDPGLLIAYWDGSAFRPIDLTAIPAGQRQTFVDTSDLWGSM